LSVLAGTACGDAKTGNAPVVATPLPSTESPAPPTARMDVLPEPTPTPSPTGSAALGTVQVSFAGTTGLTVTAFAYRQPTARSAPKPLAPDTEWASADVQICIKVASAGTPSVSNAPWSLIYADGLTAEPSNMTFNQFDAPGYPTTDRDVPAGRCIRGWITFVAPAGKKATMIEYQPDEGPTYDWSTS
jgi:hypothetical protein